MALIGKLQSIDFVHISNFHIDRSEKYTSV